ncbi:MAG: LysR family transcriptional regulator [Proteobacteria bacterium]|nr:LysR family transcriptional regulator [Pseudomonadota bacterium]
MKATLLQFETFYWVARLGSFHAAARHLRLTQPTISARIRELEASLAVNLFDRVHQRAEITAAGRDVLVRARQILRLASDLDRALHKRDPMRGLLRLGAVESVALMVLPELLSRLKSSFPDLRVELTVDVGTLLSRKLNARQLDLAIVTDPEPNDRVVAKKVGSIQLGWIASPRLVLPKGELGPADLAPLQIITNPEPSTLHTIIMEWFGQAGFEPEHISACNSHMLMSQLVCAGHALAILPVRTLRSDIRSGRLKVLTTRPRISPRPLFICQARESTSPGTDTIIRIAGEVLKQSGLVVLP